MMDFNDELARADVSSMKLPFSELRRTPHSEYPISSAGDTLRQKGSWRETTLKVETKKASKAHSKKPSTAKQSSSKLKKAPDAPKRFKSAFIFFSAEKHKEIRTDMGDKAVSATTAGISKLVSQAWKELPQIEKDKWDALARKDKARYEAERSMYNGPWKVQKKRSPKDATAPKRPMSAFLAFANSRRGAVKQKMPGSSNGDVSRALSAMWRDAPEDVRNSYVEEEKAKRHDYNIASSKWRKQNDDEKQAKRQHREEMALQMAEQLNSKDGDDESYNETNVATTLSTGLHLNDSLYTVDTTGFSDAAGKLNCYKDQMESTQEHTSYGWIADSQQQVAQPSFLITSSPYSRYEASHHSTNLEATNNAALSGYALLHSFENNFHGLGNIHSAFGNSFFSSVPIENCTASVQNGGRGMIPLVNHSFQERQRSQNTSNGMESYQPSTYRHASAMNAFMNQQQHQQQEHDGRTGMMFPIENQRFSVSFPQSPTFPGFVNANDQFLDQQPPQRPSAPFPPPPQGEYSALRYASSFPIAEGWNSAVENPSLPQASSFLWQATTPSQQKF